MSYEKDQFGSGSGEGSASVSAMILTAIAVKHPNFNVADEGVTLTTVAGTVTTINFVGSGISASQTGGILTVTASGGAGGESSASISSMILTALAPYATSASVVTALGAYVTSSSLATALGGYLSSNSFSAAIANYATSNSVSIMIGARLTSYITSASVATALATYLSSSSFATAIAPYLTSASFATAIAPYVTSASLVTTLGGYVTSTSLATALGTYLTSNSASIALAAKQPNFSVADEGVTLSTVAGTVTTINFVGTGISASLTGGILTVTSAAGTGSGEGSVSISSMITTALAPYITSNSASIALATKAAAFNVSDEGVTLTTVAGVVTQINFTGTGISASLTGGLLTVTAVAGAGSGEGSVSVSTMISTALGGGYTSTASFAAITLAGRPVGAVLLGYQTLSNVNNFGFSGSWSDFCVLQCQALYRIETGTSATASAAIYSDGGTTPFLNLATASNTQSANQIIAVDYTVYGGNARPIKLMRVNGTTGTNLQRVAATATANTAFVNAIKYFSSATMTAGMAVLYGWRTS